MMEMDAGGSCVEWAGVCSNHSLSEVRRLQPFVAQEIFNELSHRPIEEHVLCLLVSAEPFFNLFDGWRLADPQIAIACRTQCIAQSAKDVTHRAPAWNILRSKGANFRFAPFVTFPKLNA